MSSHLSIYKSSLTLLTDLYQITMAYAYWKEGIHERQAIFHLYFRKKPFNGSYAISAGLADAIEFIQKFKFSKDDIAYLASLKGSDDNPLFDKNFLSYLAKLKLKLDIDAIPEGVLTFPNEPLMRVKGSILHAQLLESPLLNIINFQTLIATKASRVCMAAQNDEVIEFGMRRAQGIDGAISATRASFIGGCRSTSHLLAGKLFDIPVKGTQAHSFVMAFDKEERAFLSFCENLKGICVALIDTYDSIEGTKKIIKVAEKLKKEGIKLLGVRLDSGDLKFLSIEVRRLLDEAGLKDVVIMASNELDEYLIDDLKLKGGKITLWGVGTNLVTAKGQSALDGIYKLSAIKGKDGKWQNKIKISNDKTKVTIPGFLQVKRYFNGKNYVADMIFSSNSKGDCMISLFDQKKRKICLNKISSKAILKPIFKRGKLVYKNPTLKEIQKKTLSELARLPLAITQLNPTQQYLVGLEKSLYEERERLINSPLV